VTGVRRNDAANKKPDKSLRLVGFKGELVLLTYSMIIFLCHPELPLTITIEPEAEMLWSSTTPVSVFAGIASVLYNSVPLIE
jgi:hypothetical protein